MSVADELQALVTQVRALEADNASLRRENKRLRLQQNKAKPASTGSPWAVLGVAHDANAVDVLSAFRSLSKQHHPDLPGGNREKFEALVAARDQMLLRRGS